jgi:WS/DGAT/MGAT family acyltransferase
MPPPAPHQLADGDAIFLSMETPTASGHVGAILLLDPSTAPGGFDYERLVEHIASRLSHVPRFTWRVKEVPFGLDRPYWTEAPDFSVREHVIRTAVPSPGTREQVNALAARLHAQPMDRSRPLWEVWCIEGVEGGRVALYMKTHHCLVDGTGGAGLSEVLADFTPDASGPAFVPPAFQEGAPQEPDPLDMVRRTLRNDSERVTKLGSHLVRGIREVMRKRAQKDESGVIDEIPTLPFNGNVARRRAFASATIDLERVSDLKKHFEVKLNDVVLALTGSAVRRWLRERDALPQKPAVAMCPVSIRGEEKGLGNQVTNMAVSLGTHVEDPIERLQEIHQSSRLAKAAVEQGSFDSLAAVGECLKPSIANLFVRSASLAPTAMLPGNLVVSNVRSAPVPLYLAGAQIETMMPLSILQTGMGLNVTVISYCNKIDVGVIVDPELVPDPQTIADAFEHALEELEGAARGVRYVSDHGAVS